MRPWIALVIIICCLIIYAKSESPRYPWDTGKVPVVQLPADNGAGSPSPDSQLSPLTR